MQPVMGYAAPVGGVVSGGTASINNSGANTIIQQSSARAVIDWQSFDVAPGEHVDFQQPNSHAITFNRIHDSKASAIDGRLTANGRVWFSNAHGVVFGRNAQVNVGSLIATAADMSNADFMGGSNHFTIQGNGGAVVENYGSITVADAGLAALVAPTVKNDGIITARLGKVVLASAETFAVDTYGDGLINLAVSDAVAQNVSNTGTLSAEGGVVRMTAAAVGEALSGVINTNGLVQASSINIKGGFVSLGGTVNADGATGGDITVEANRLSLAENVTARGTVGKGGTISFDVKDTTVETATSVVDASGAADGGSITHVAGNGLVSSGTYKAAGGSGVGGNIDMTADTVALMSASFDASGYSGGGTIRIGGEYQGGKNLAIDELKNARTIALDDGVSINASATHFGNGGTVILWSDEDTSTR